MRLETPARIGSATRPSAAASSSSLSPWRSVPKARTARGRHRRRVDLLPLRVERQQRPALHPARRALDRGDGGQRVVEPGGAAHGVGVPGVVLADRQQRRRVGRRGDPHAGAEVAHVARLLEQDDRRLARVGERRRRGRRACGGRSRRPRCAAPAAPARRARRRRPAADHRREAPRQVRRQVGREPLQLGRVDRHRRLHLGPEAQRVLERMEALQHRQLRITPGGAKPAAKLVVGHGGIVPGLGAPSGRPLNEPPRCS